MRSEISEGEVLAAAILQLKLTLTDIRPPVWRRLLVANQITLKRLHESIQAMAGWEDKHQHEFVIAEKRYGRPARHEMVPVQNEALFRLHSLSLEEGSDFTYVYDFGDRWRIEIAVERVLRPDPRAPSVLVIEGARAFPPEDSGGAAGYEELREVLADPSDPDHEECVAWAGEDFDPEGLDVEAANHRLSLLDQK